MAHIHVEAPAGWDPLDIAQAIVGGDYLLKAERIKTGEHTWHRYRPMKEAHHEDVEAYRRLFVRMVDAIQAFLEKEVVAGLGKAEDPLGWVLISPEHLEELRRIIGDWHEAFVAGRLNPALLKKGELQRLIDAGIVSQDLKYVYHPHEQHEKPPETKQVIREAFEFGIALAGSKTYEDQAGLKFTSYDAWNRKSKRPLSAAENAAVRWSEHRAAQYVRGLGNRIADSLGTVVVDRALEHKHREQIKEAVSQNVWKRESWRKIVTDLRDQTKDYARDYARIGATEKQAAMQEGVARELVDRYGDPKRVRVAKIPAPDACQHCVRLHLTSGQGSPPRVFPLSELIGNGTNVGRKAASWRAVVGPTHPWCFVPGTSVKIEMGNIPIEAILPGMLVPTHLGRLRAVQRLSKRTYRGELVVLFVGDKSLHVTPEHPFLTQRGWVRAGEVQPGDCLMHIADTGTELNPHDLPLEQAQQILFCRILRELARGGMPVSWVDFDGDAEVWEPDVDVETNGSQLWNAFVSRLEKEIVNLSLGSREKALAFNALRRFELLANGPWQTATSFVCRFREAQSVLRAALACDDQALLGDGSDADAVGEQATGDGASSGVVLTRKLLDALASFVLSNDPSLVQLQALGHTEPRYHGVAVKSIDRVDYAGPVYNFAVEEDESYIAEGFVVHNCGCELVHVPEGWLFDETGNMIPEVLKRSELLERNLMKALTYGDAVPESTVAVRVGDPHLRAVVERVVAETPPEIFTRGSGVTLITTDHDRPNVPLEGNDFAYWTANEIRLMQTLPAEKAELVVRHEISHSLNVWLVKQLGSVVEVRKWHDRLFKLSKREGFVSDYAKREPIENAAEATRMYLYHRKRMMVRWPLQFAFLHRAYRDLLRSKPDEIRPTATAT